MNIAGNLNNDVIFQPLKFRNLTVKNRLFRSSISGRWDNYNGTGTQARINWEESFARGGIGAIISSFVPIHIEGRILPNYAMIDSDDKIPFWRRVGDTLEVSGTVRCGTVAATAVTITLPTGLSIDTAKAPTAQYAKLGLLDRFEVFESKIICNSSSSASVVGVAEDDGASGYEIGLGNALFSDNNHLSFEFSCPISGWSAVS